ncbi:MAG: 30S ribosomal protein S10 [Candidatus Pacebacteria bacterium]|nr:30S ribosomal protein S10 [Candidatus Paceibacterota bacterium]
MSKLRIIVSAFESKALDQAVKEIIQNIDKLGAEVRGPVPLPTKAKKWTVNRSSFVYEESKEQYEMKVHRRLIDIVNPNQKIVESLTNLSLPSGINVDVKMI